MKLLIILLASLSLSGCLIGPKNADQLRLNYHKEHIVCVDKSHEETFEFLLKRMSQCYVGTTEVATATGGAFISSGSSGKVIGTYNKDGRSNIVISVHGGGLSFVTGMVDIESTQACKAKVNIYFHNSFWDDHAADFKEWLMGNNEPCSSRGT